MAKMEILKELFSFDEFDDSKGGVRRFSTLTIQRN